MTIISKSTSEQVVLSRSGSWGVRGRPACARWVWLVVAVTFSIVLSAVPVSAQEAGDQGWILQGGPIAGASFLGERQFELGFRLGARHGTRVVDLSASTYPVQFIVPVARHRGFEALAGVAWQPSMIGIGFRSGLGLAPNAFGKLWSVLAFGPHYTLVVPIGSSLELRGEAGIHFFYFRSEVLEGSRGFVRLGIERRWR